MSESRLKTRIERNTEIITDVYNYFLLHIINKYPDRERIRKHQEKYRYEKRMEEANEINSNNIS